MRLQLQQTRCNHLQTHAHHEVDRRLHPVDARDVQNARLVALRARHEDDLVLRLEVWRDHVPRPEQRRTQQIEMRTLHKNDARRARPEQPLVRIGAEEIHVLHARRKRAERLDGIEGKEHSALVQQRANRIHIDPIAGEKMAARERDQPRARSQRRGDQLGRDFARRRRFEQPHHDAAPPQFHPRIHVRRVIALVADHLVPFLPRKPVGEEAEPERSRPEQRDFIRPRADERRARLPGIFDVAQHLAKLLRILRALPHVVSHRVRHHAGQRRDAGVGEIDLLAADREKRAALGFVRVKIHGR